MAKFYQKYISNYLPLFPEKLLHSVNSLSDTYSLTSNIGNSSFDQYIYFQY